MFISGTMVEVSSMIENLEMVWLPALVIKEVVEKDDEKKYIVKFCCNKGIKANVTVDSSTVRPTPPPFLAEEYRLLDSVEAFCGSKWRKGVVKGIVSGKRYLVSFEATNKQLTFDCWDLRPPMEWEDGVWKTKESPLAQGSGNKSIANESVSVITQSPIITATPSKQNGLGNDSTREKGKPEKETTPHGKRNKSVALEVRNVQTKEPLLAQGSGNEKADGVLNAEITATLVKHDKAQGKTSNEKTLEPNQNGLGKQPTREKMPEEHNNRKRKRGELEHNSDLNETVLSSDLTSNYVAPDDEKTKAKDTTMVLPFAKKSPIWKTYESMEVFKRVPQSPHFNPLFEAKEAFREGYALGMMVTFSGLLENLKALEKDVLISQLDSLKDSFTELEKHGFNVTAPLSRINKLLALKDRQLHILETQKGFYKEMTGESSKKHKAEQEYGEMERKMLEVKHKILKLQRQEMALQEHMEAAKERKDLAYEKICRMESCARDLGVELENVEFEFETILSAPW